MSRLNMEQDEENLIRKGGIKEGRNGQELSGEAQHGFKTGYRFFVFKNNSPPFIPGRDQV
jgi:hypothetical protein